MAGARYAAASKLIVLAVALCTMLVIPILISRRDGGSGARNRIGARDYSDGARATLN